MSKHLVIVESPAKAKTIEKYLGKDYQVMASYGHVRDLVPKEGAVDPANDFAMQYAVIDRNKKHVDAIAKALKNADSLFLATDPDREGEAISWHLYELLREKGLLKDKNVRRVVFHEITKRAIQDAIEHSRDLSMDLVNAQQARRALDYLVGFNLSPLLWRKIHRGLSAGRVQSPALRMICEREEEIEAFEPQEYWTIESDLKKDEQPFQARLTYFQGEKIEQFTINNEARATEVEQALTAAGEQGLPVQKVDRKQRRRNPAAPFTTSTLQQEASRKLGFGAQRTMRVAQQLYEGIDTGGGAVGLITYMRTDSVNLAQDAVQEMRGVIEERFGADKVPDSPQVYRTKAKNAQEAHEAIRPTSAARHPDDLKGQLSDDQRRLYELIWKRALASQMKHATINTVAVDLGCGEGNTLRANGSTVADPGFMAVYQEGTDDAKGPGDSKDRILPEMKEGDVVDLVAIRPEQHFTEPPPRYSEASLVRTLEEYGIGRPSTYASIISTLVNREYVELDNKRFHPTAIGRVVNKFLTDHFTQYVDYDFTARLEDELDEISLGQKDWVPLLRDFWEPFKARVEEKKDISREEVVQARELGTDPKTGKPVQVRVGRFGPFVQLGTKDDDEKPRFAGLRPGQRMDDITLDEALTLFQLPRDLGETDEGEPLQASIGRFGPYVKYGSKFVSLKEDDPYTITPERAKEVVAEKKKEDANRIINEFEGGIRVLKGRYGPYVTDGKKNAKIPKDVEPESLDLAACQELIAKAPERKGRRKGTTSKSANAKGTTRKRTAKSS
ncbi:DNA topoisomerase I [Aquisalimonas asiatica]|uniref:DNA topoisomerase 1 n=1 Tax=Aquisalimonas asiatica TaxID=406100 RepID=A0A1H8TBL4_9GAMM|nr:DNA topoisomerase I [Aquisalimonas asiatica]SEO88490.1 DNA topoisomerase I [Aquisalimonas asiatica]